MTMPEFVVHFNYGDGDTHLIACNRTIDHLPVTDYSFVTRSVTCKRCQRTLVFQQAAAKAALVEERIAGAKDQQLGGKPEINAATIDWTMEGASLDVEPECWLKAHVIIAGVSMHLEAIEVVIEDGMQVGICPNLDEILCNYAGGAGAEGHFQTMTREGHEYALFATPFTQ